MSKIDLEGVTRIATRYLTTNPPKDRSQAMDALIERFGAYDQDRDSLVAGLDAYYDTQSKTLQ